VTTTTSIEARRLATSFVVHRELTVEPPTAWSRARSQGAFWLSVGCVMAGPSSAAAAAHGRMLKPCRRKPTGVASATFSGGYASVVPRVKRAVSWLLILTGIGLAAWTITVWQWQDPVTALYTAHRQAQLLDDFREEAKAYQTASVARSPASRPSVAKARKAPAGAYLERLADDYAAKLPHGAPLGVLVIPRLGLRTAVVNGTDEADLRAGPGRDERTGMPGQRQMVYIAGHRTTFGAPFSDLDKLVPGDVVRLELPYAVFTYRVTGSRIVAANDLSVLRTGSTERLVLQACHPRFFATHRLLVDATPSRIGPPPSHF
jgi:sortase A